MTDWEEYYEATKLPEGSRFKGHDVVNGIRRTLAKYGHENQSPPTEIAALAEDAFDTYENLLHATNENSWDLDKLEPWRNKFYAVHLQKKHREPYIQKPEVEGAAEQYLNLPIRIEAMDRVLVDALMASEILEYIDHPVTSQLKSRSLGCGIFGNVALGAFLLWISDGAGWAVFLSIVLFVWPILGFIYQSRRSKPATVFIAMRDAYQFMAGGPTSVLELRAAIERAREAGVVWPNVLFVLLEDIAERRKSI